MKLSFSTNAFVRHSLHYAVESVASLGYEGVELLADVPHLYADRVSKEDVAALKDAVGRLGLQVANINANTVMGYYGKQFWEPLFEPSIVHPDPSLRLWRVNYTRKCIDLAVELGAPCVSITSGRPVPGVLPEQSMDYLRASLTELLDYSARRGIRVGMEYEPGLLIERYEELAGLIDEMGSPFLGANLDLGHSHVMGEDPEEVIQGLQGRIWHVHIEDIRGNKHYHLIPGAGDLDFERLFITLRNNGYDGFATVELYTYPGNPEQAAREATRHLRPILQNTMTTDRATVRGTSRVVASKSIDKGVTE